MTSIIDLAQLSKSAYAESGAPEGWERLPIDVPNNTGYYGAAFVKRDATGLITELVVAHRGSELSTIEDIQTNLDMASSEVPGQYDYAKQLLSSALDYVSLNAPQANITITGHSLGGAIAQLQGAETGLPVVTFNAYGAGNLIPEFLNQYGDPSGRIATGDYSNISNYRTLMDGVSQLPGSLQLGVMTTQVSPEEIPFIGPASLGNPLIRFWWSHSIDRFITEQVNLSQVKRELIELSKTLNLPSAALFPSPINLAATGFALANATSPIYSDPLTLDLDGDGIETLSRTQGAYFDHAADGFAEATGWVAPDDGLLVRDLNGNGTIDSGRELFGDQTVLASGSKAANGFAALADLDSNSDGKVDASDTAWAELKVWKDANSDGTSTANELLTMEQAGVSTINTGYTSPNTNFGNGNTLAQAGTFTRLDSTSGQAGSLLFSRDTADSVATEWLSIPTELLALPDLSGFGLVYDLHQAMARDASLVTLVQTLAALPTTTGYDAYKTTFQAMLYKWTGAESVIAGARGTFVDAKHLKVLELFLGESFRGQDGSGNPNNVAGPQLETLYTQLMTDLVARFVAQAQLSPAISAIQIEFLPSGELALNMQGVAAELAAQYATNPDAALSSLAWLMKVAPTLELSTVQGWSTLGDALAGSAGTTDLPAGYQHLIANPGASLYAGTDIGNTLSGSSSADVLQGLAGNDTLHGLAGNDVLSGGDGDDVLNGGSGRDLLLGGAGNDVLGGQNEPGYSVSYDTGYYLYGSFFSPGAGNTYQGGTGNDTLNGTALADLYLFNLGDGADVINEANVTGQPSGQIDKLRFGPGILASEIQIKRDGANLVLQHTNGTDRVTIKDWYLTSTSPYRIELVEFSDGTTWDSPYLTATGLVVVGTDGNDTLSGRDAFSDTLLGAGGNDILRGYAGNDVLEGGDGNDILDGGAGLDTLRGGAGDDILGGQLTPGYTVSHDTGYSAYGGFVSPGYGNIYEGGTGNDTLNGTALSDTYLFNLGDGADVINETYVSYQPGNQVDVLKFGSGISPTDVTIQRSGVDLVLSLPLGTDRVTIKNWYLSHYAGTTSYRLEQVEFTDGTIWDSAYLTQQGLIVAGTTGNDTLNGLDSQHDTLLGGAGNDTLRGYAGYDTLDGGDGNDILDGGTGGDTLRGGAGDDILGGQISPGRTYSDDTGYYNVGNFYNPGAGNTYEGGTGADTLNGTALADLYLFNLGDGADLIIEPNITGQPGGQIDVLRFGPGISQTDIQIVRSGINLVLKHVNGTDQVTVKSWYDNSNGPYRIERIEFADGSAWDSSYLTTEGLIVRGTEGADTLSGIGWYGDTLLGNGGNDTLLGGDGLDTLNGGEGNDTLDGSWWTDTLIGGAGDDTLGGTSYEELYGNWAAYQKYAGSTASGNIYEGGQGNDTLRGTYGADVYYFNLGDGADTLYELDSSGQTTYPVDVLRFGAGITTSDISVLRVGTDLILKHSNNLDQITIKSWFTSGLINQIERVEFADGSVWANTELTNLGLLVEGTGGDDTITGLDNFGDLIRGGAGNDTLYGKGGSDIIEGGDGNDVIDGNYAADILRGGAGDDTLGGAQNVVSNNTDTGFYNGQFWGPGAGNTYEGGTGNDLLRGSCLSDVYIFNRGDGNDTLYELELTGQPTGQVDILRFGAGVKAEDLEVFRNGTDVVFKLTDGSGQLTVKNWATTGTANQIERVEFADGSYWTVADIASQFSNRVTGSSLDDTLSGTASKDSMHGLEGSDTLTGDAGNDLLFGEAGDDLLFGGLGDDVLRGGAGNDTIDGQSGADLIQFGFGDGADTVYDESGADTLSFDASLSGHELYAKRHASDLMLETDTGDSIQLVNWFAGQSKTAIETEQGTVIAQASLTAAFSLPTVTLSNQTGLYGMENFAPTLTGLDPYLAYLSEATTPLYGMSGAAYIQANTQGVAVGAFADGRTVYEAEFSGDFSGSVTDDPWMHLKYLYWEDGQGGVDFSFEAASCGTGGYGNNQTWGLTNPQTLQQTESARVSLGVI